MKITDQLQKLPAFRRVSAEDLEEFVSVCKAVKFKSRDIVLEQGGDADVAYLVVAGTLEVSVKTERTWHHIAVIQPGEIVGESALFVRGVPRNATVFAHKDSRCLVLRPRQLRSLGKNRAVVALEVSLIAALSRRIRKTNLEIQSAWSEDEAPSQTSDALDTPPKRSVAERLRAIFGRRGASQ